jgi:lysophospholipase L1-like esterase
MIRSLWFRTIAGSVLRSNFLAFVLLALPWNGHAQHAPVWVGAWASSQQIPEPKNALGADDLRDATLRQIVHLSIGGSAIRVHLSNAFGVAPLHLMSVHVARSKARDSATIDAAADRELHFAGRIDVIIPAGAEYVSDPLDYAVAAGADLAISIHYGDPPEQETGHPGARATSYLVHGDMVSGASFTPAKNVDHWYQLSGVDVARDGGFSIVALGDSITDGHGATTNGNDRWPDLLARRLQAAGRHSVGVLNEGIGGNRVLDDGPGPNALARFDRDVLAQTAVRYVIVLEGVNDLGLLARTMRASAEEHAVLVRRIIAAYAQMVARAHAHGVFAIGSTILPYGGSDYYHPDAVSEADRQTVNAWIRSAGHFDAVIDFDKTMRDPSHPDRLLPKFDSGDHLHPSPAGYAAMADSVPLSMFGAR